MDKNTYLTNTKRITFTAGSWNPDLVRAYVLSGWSVLVEGVFKMPRCSKNLIRTDIIEHDDQLLINMLIDERNLEEVEKIIYPKDERDKAETIWDVLYRTALWLRYRKGRWEVCHRKCLEGVQPDLVDRVERIRKAIKDGTFLVVDGK